MYKVNPEVNVELKQRLPVSSKQQHASDTLTPRSTAGCSDKRTPTPTQADGTQGVHPLFQEVSRSSRSPSPLSLSSPHSVRRSPGALSPRPPPPAPSSPLSPRLPIPPPPAPCGLSPRAPVPPAPVRMEVDSHTPLPKTDSLGGSEKKSGVDRDQNISFLLKELDSLRELNKKLQEQCVQQQRELENRRLEVQIQPEWNHTAALVEEIYSAQRSRDEAVMMRLRLANEERDHALLHAKHLQHTQLESIKTGEESDADLEEVLQSVLTADSSQAVERAGSVLVDKLLKSRQRSTNITQQEMNVVIQERQAAVAKLKRLEQELINLREQNQSTHTHEEVEHLERERDNALKVNQALEAELQTQRANHSLHQSSETACVSSREDGSAEQQLSSQLQQLSTQHQLTQGELQRCQQAEREAQHKVQQLERLVEVLRKKVGTGNVRAVI